MTSLDQTDKTSKSPEAAFRAGLRAVGMDWKAVSAILPDWAEHAYSSSAGRLELRGFIARHLGLAVDSAGQFTRGALPDARFKTTGATKPAEVDVARSVATACSRLVATAVRTEWNGIASSPAELRSAIRETSANNWVDLKSLLDFCWSAGVPALYLPSLPTSEKKMEGMVTFVKGRPVIVVSKKQDQPDWALFTLAHELAHIALGHLPEADGQAIVDDKVEAVEKSTDVQEIEANKFALSLLTASESGIQITARLPTAAELAGQAISYGTKHGISPGHVVLNAVRNTKIDGKALYPLGQAALKHLPVEITGGSTFDLFRDAAQKYLDIDLLKHDSAEYLEKLGVI